MKGPVSLLERVIAMQLEAFNHLVTLQLQVLAARGAAASPVTELCEASSDRSVPSVRSVRSSRIPLTEVQRDLYTVTQLGEEASLAYLEPGVLELRGPLDDGLLRRALQAVVNRHEALRSVFPPPGPGDAEPFQVVLPEVRLDMPLYDATGCPPELLLNMHHIVSDGWSLGLLAQEISAHYLGAGVPELPVRGDRPRRRA